VHDDPARNLRALCMPYFGGTTLARVLEALRDVHPGQRTGAHLVDVLREVRPEPPGVEKAPGPAGRLLAQGSYTRAVCWVGACLAEALQYAHERGLVHLD